MGNYEKRDVFNKIDTLTTSSGVIVLHGKNDILHVSKTANIKKTIENLVELSKQDQDVFKMVSLTETVDIIETDTLLEALIIEKVNFSDSMITYKNIGSSIKYFAYLALDFNSVPYLKVEEDTQGNKFYIGPFLSRFFILDYIELLAENYKLPLCENSDFPCNRYPKKCDGFCLKSASQNKLMFEKNYVFADNEREKNLSDSLFNLLDNLQFEAAENLKEQIKMHQRFNKYLIFYHVTKGLSTSIEIKDYSIQIDQGLIKSIHYQNNDYDFSLAVPQFRDNERLAIDKSNLKEAWIVFDYLYKQNFNLISDIYTKSVEALKKEWSE